MYNSKFPGVEACVDPEKYDGQFAYVYAKRGQVLLAERLAAQEPRVAFISSHPGWTRTAAVEAAYGSSAKYLEPMRTAWQGAEGQCWLCVVDRDRLENGGFYLDRAPQRKHLAGPFFTGGSATAARRRPMVRDLDARVGKQAARARAGGVLMQRPSAPFAGPARGGPIFERPTAPPIGPRVVRSKGADACSAARSPRGY